MARASVTLIWGAFILAVAGGLIWWISRWGAPGPEEGGGPAPRPPAGRPPGDPDRAFHRRVREACSACHVWTPPQIFPRWGWPETIRKMFTLANEDLLETRNRPIRGLPVDGAEGGPQVRCSLAAQLQLNLAVELGLDAHDLELSYQALPQQL